MVTENRRPRGSTLVDLRKVRVERLAATIAEHLQSGHVIAEVADAGAVDVWRSAARKAGRNRGWKVRTGTTGDGQRVWAVREDLEVSREGSADAMARFNYLLAASAFRQDVDPVSRRTTTARQASRPCGPLRVRPWRRLDPSGVHNVRA